MLSCSARRNGCLQINPRYVGEYRADDMKPTDPFSYGPRGCPGAATAINVLRSFIAMFLWKLDLEEVSRHYVKFDKCFIFLTFWKRTKYRMCLP